MKKKRRMWIALGGFIAVAAVLVVVASQAPSEKKIEQPLERQYATHDPQFRRAMSVLLGPQILDGNQVEVLLNGDQIFRDDRTNAKPVTLEQWKHRPWKEKLVQRAAAPLRTQL